MIHKQHIHNDPSRCPKLQIPIEEGMIQLHSIESKKMLIDITKELVQMKKK